MILQVRTQTKGYNLNPSFYRLCKDALVSVKIVAFSSQSAFFKLLKFSRSFRNSSNILTVCCHPGIATRRAQFRLRAAFCASVYVQGQNLHGSPCCRLGRPGKVCRSQHDAEGCQEWAGPNSASEIRRPTTAVLLQPSWSLIFIKQKRLNNFAHVVV